MELAVPGDDQIHQGPRLRTLRINAAPGGTARDTAQPPLSLDPWLSYPPRSDHSLVSVVVGAIPTCRTCVQGRCSPRSPAAPAWQPLVAPPVARLVAGFVVNIFLLAGLSQQSVFHVSPRFFFPPDPATDKVSASS